MDAGPCGHGSEALDVPSELAILINDVPMTAAIHTDIITLLIYHGCEGTVGHVRRVAREAKRLAVLLDANAQDAEVAGWLHDISVVIPNEQRIPIAEHLGLEILPEERTFPMIIHQKLSAAIARELFGVRNDETLSAIACHTTPKANASLLDRIVFVADKIKWDQPGVPPYLQELLESVEKSMDRAAGVYLGHLWNNRDKLRVCIRGLRTLILSCGVRSFRSLDPPTSAFSGRVEAWVGKKQTVRARTGQLRALRHA